MSEITQYLVLAFSGAAVVMGVLWIIRFMPKRPPFSLGFVDALTSAFVGVLALLGELFVFTQLSEMQHNLVLIPQRNATAAIFIGASVVGFCVMLLKMIMELAQKRRGKLSLDSN